MVDIDLGWDEKAADHAVAHHTYEHLSPNENALYVSGFTCSARWQRDQLRSDEAVERVIRQAKAEARDEGRASAEYDHVSGRIIADTPNPYRKEASDDERTRIEVRNEGTQRFPRFVAEWDGVEVNSNNAFGLDSELDLAGAPRPRDLVLVEEEASDD